MKVLLINGSPNQYGCTYTALNEITKVLSKHDIKTEILYLGKETIPGCIRIILMVLLLVLLFTFLVQLVN